MESFEVQFASFEIEDIAISAAGKKTSRALLEIPCHIAFSLFPVKNSNAKSLGIIRKNLNSNWGMCKCVNTKLLRVMVENL
jgi:hypothetical protein